MIKFWHLHIYSVSFLQNTSLFLNRVRFDCFFQWKIRIFLDASLELRQLLEQNEFEPPTLFIELLELAKDKQNESVWRETSRYEILKLRIQFSLHIYY